jgi:hypothetical protein
MRIYAYGRAAVGLQILDSQFLPQKIVVKTFPPRGYQPDEISSLLTTNYKPTVIFMNSKARLYFDAMVVFGCS